MTSPSPEPEPRRGDFTTSHRLILNRGDFNEQGIHITISTSSEPDTLKSGIANILNKSQPQQRDLNNFLIEVMSDDGDYLQFQIDAITENNDVNTDIYDNNNTINCFCKPFKHTTKINEHITLSSVYNIYWYHNPLEPEPSPEPEPLPVSETLLQTPSVQNRIELSNNNNFYVFAIKYESFNISNLITDGQYSYTENRGKYVGNSLYIKVIEIGSVQIGNKSDAENDFLNKLIQIKIYEDNHNSRDNWWAFETNIPWNINYDKLRSVRLQLYSR